MSDRFSWPVFGGLAPLLSLGFVTSALANRWAFAAWALGAGAVYTAALHRAFAMAVSTSGKVGIALTVAAVSLALFGHLMARYHDALDLGARAVLPGLYHPALTHPGLGYGLAALLAGGALFVFLKGRRS